MQVRPLEIGPLVGHTTATGFRLWGRVRDAASAVGVARIRQRGSRQFGPAAVFAFEAWYDGVGIVDFGHLFAGDGVAPLPPRTNYEFQIGWVTALRREDVAAAVDALDWPAWAERGLRSGGTVTTFPAENGIDVPTVFLVGSCRDPTSLGDKGETSFGSILGFTDETSQPAANFILMTGDQIYIDPMLVSVDARNGASLEQYWERYREAFALPRFSSVMRRLPAYMMMDDHEVQNNWTLGKVQANKDYRIETMSHGLQAYEAYQASLSPLVRAANFRAECFPLVAGLTRYHYCFRHGQSDFFVLDVRSESEVGGVRNGQPIQAPLILRRNHQFQDLKDWLIDGFEGVKFVVSPVPVFPDTKGPFGSPEDKWGGAVAQRSELLDYIWQNRDKIPRLIFLSGDVHVSFVSKLQRQDVPDYRVYNVVSSAFNWVPPGLQEWNFKWGPLERVTTAASPKGDYVSSRYRTEGQAGVHKVNNYARISAYRGSVTVEFIRGKTGECLETVALTF